MDNKKAIIPIWVLIVGIFLMLLSAVLKPSPFIETTATTTTITTTNTGNVQLTNACSGQLQITIPLVNEELLVYNAYSAHMYQLLPDGTRTKAVFGCGAEYNCEDLYLIVKLCPENTESFVHAGMIKNQCKNKNGTYIKDIYSGGKWYNYKDLAYVTGRPGAVSITGWRLVDPLPSNVP